MPGDSQFCLYMDVKFLYVPFSKAFWGRCPNTADSPADLPCLQCPVVKRKCRLGANMETGGSSIILHQQAKHSPVKELQYGQGLCCSEQVTPKEQVLELAG